jgi:hypothetical protein
MRAVGYLKTDLSNRKQCIHLLVLCSLGISAVVLMLILVLPFFWSEVPRWDKAYYVAGRPGRGAKAPTWQGLHITRTTLGSSMRDDVLWLRVGTNVWALEVLTPMN